MIGSKSARLERRGARVKPGASAVAAAAAFPQRLLSLFMAAALAVSLVPSAAWAQESGTSAPAQAGAGGAASPDVPDPSPEAGAQEEGPGSQASDDASSSGSEDPAPSPAPSPSGDATASPSSAVAPGPSSEGGTSSQAPAQGRQGAPATPSAAPRDAVQLSGVELAKPSSFELGTKLEAKAYTGPSYAPTYVTEGVTYTWKYAVTTSPSYGTEWTEIEGETGSTFTVDDEKYLGACITVSATAGGSTVDFSSSYPYGYGPFKPKGAVDIYSASLSNGETSTYVFAVGDTVTAQAKEKGATDPIDADKLAYQWQASTDNAAFSAIPGATDASLVLDEGYADRYVRCVLTAKVGDSTYTTRATNRIAAAGSVNVTSVTLDKSGKVSPGDVLTATAKVGSQDVTASDKVTWSWYCGDSAYTTETLVTGATGNTFEVTDDLVGRYLEARADGGFGEEDSSAAGPVVKAGSVELYKVEASGSARVGSTLTAKAYTSSSEVVSDQDVVDYQWQYAETNTTSDGAFKDIPGATGKTYVVGDAIDGTSSLGKYLRVKATSDGSVVSTKKPSYYGTTDVDPLGPVMLPGAYELSSVALSSSGQGMQAGNAITPKAQVKEGYGESDVPSDAKVTYTWWVRDDAQGAFRQLSEGVAADGTLTLGEALVGKQVKVSANALVEGNSPESGTYTVLAKGEYDLLRATLSPSSGDLFTGDELSASVLAKRLGSTSYGDDVTSDVAVSWSVADAKDGTFVPLASATGTTIVLPPEAAGKFVKATATSGSSVVEAVTSTAVVDAASLEGAAKRLDAASFRPNPEYGTDTNMNALVEAKLAELGYDDVAVSTASATPTSTNEQVFVGVSAAADETNGAITYCFVDPDSLNGSSVNYTTARQFKYTFVLERGGETYEYQPWYTGTIPWDDARMADLLSQKAAGLAPRFAGGDSADSVTQDFTMPLKLADADGNAKSWTSLSWTSSDPAAVRVTGGSWGDSAYTGAVVRTSLDQKVTLTAEIGFSGYGMPEVTATKAFDVVVKSDPEQVAEATAALAQKVEAGFVPGAVLDAETGAVVDADHVTGDLRLPTPSKLGVDGKDYAVTYTASSDALVVNGYAASVFRPLPGQAATDVDLVATVTDKANPEITASKSLSFSVDPLDRAAIEAEVALMQAAKAGYFDALANGQAADAVTTDLHAFQKAYLDGEGNLAWAYDRSSADAAGDGIVPVDLEGYDPMGSAGWRLFRSSRPDVVAHESLRVTQPEYRTDVTVSSRLSSQKYARYADAYADDPTYGPLFAQLANQDVTCTFSVEGTAGQDDPHVTATCSVIGVDAQGAAQTWVAASPYTLDAGATAADLSEALFAQAGLSADYDPDGAYGWELKTITSPFDAGQTLGWDEATGRYWQLFVNGQPASTGASGVVLQAGDSVIWCYSAYGDPAPTDRLSVTCEVVGTDASGAWETWATPTTMALEAGSTAADLSEALFAQVGLVADTGVGDYGWFLNSIASPYDGRVLGSVLVEPPYTYAYWQLFVNGEMASVGAGGYTLQAGDKVTWCYGSDGTLPGQVAATAQVIGMDANGNTQTWASEATYRLVEGATAADLFEQMLVMTGLSADYDPDGAYGWSLNTITSPFDGRTLGWDAATGQYWQLFVNGKASEFGAGSVVLQPGDEIVWCYSAYGSELPDPGEVVIVPDAPRPSFDAAWSGFADGMGGSSVANRPTPTESAEAAWTYDYRAGLPDMAAASEPVIVNGRVFLVVTNELRMIDAQTGVLLSTAPLGSTISYQCRPVYADGLVVVPADDGTLTAFTADTLTCVWKTAPLPTDGYTSGYQALSSLTVNGGCVYAAFTMVGSSGAGKVGTLLCVNLADGSVAWTRTDEAQQDGVFGYYWAGAAPSGDDVVVGDESGMVSLVDGATGAVLSSVSLGAACRAGVVADASFAGQAYLAVTADGTLHRIVRKGDALALDASVSFAGKSTSTPAVAAGKAFVCAVDAEGYGTLSVIDLATMAVERTVRGGAGEAQCAPLVSVQGDGSVYAYFTCNGLPGGVYGYRLGDDAAYALYTPDAAHQQYCMSSVAVDEAGNLYYTNDSGTLFALAGRPGASVTFDANGGSYVAPSYVALGSPVVRPADPVRAGYRFDGWYRDKACTQAWDFSTPVTGALTLYAKWTAKGGGSGGSADDANDGGSGGSSGVKPRPAGTVAPGHAPLVQLAADQQAAEDGQAVAEEAAGKEAGGSDGTSALGSGRDRGVGDRSTGGGANAPGGANPWAAGGLALGVVGLAGAGAYLLRARHAGTPKDERKA